MSASDFLCELETAGVQIRREDDNLRVRGRQGVSLAPYLDAIRANKSTLIALLTPLDREIIVSEAGRRSPKQISRAIESIEARLRTSKEFPGDRLSLRYWQAIKQEEV